ncbi:MAG: histidine kinase [Candidatus Dormibacteria bacterium]
MGPQDLGYPLNAIAFAVVGALVAARQPRNPVWILMSANGLIAGVFGFGNEYTILVQLTHPGILPGGRLAAWLTTWVFQVIPTLFALTFLLFPTGRPPSPRWNWVLWLVPVYALVGWVPPMFLPGWTQNVAQGDAGPVHNPLAARALEPALRQVAGLSNVVLGVLMLAAIASLVVRYRAAGPEERHQLKYFIFAGAFLPLGFVVYPLYTGGGIYTPTGMLAFAAAMIGVIGLPVAIGIAILKYRLYDIDLVINRALVYGSLAAFITAVYIGIVVGVGTAVGSGSRPNLVLSIIATAVVAVAFQPVRERLQRIANRVVYGRRATPYEVLSPFSRHVAGSFAGEEVLPRMARVLAEGTGSQQASVWVTGGDLFRRAACWPESPGEVPLLKFYGSDLPAFPGAARAIEVRHRGEVLGAVTIAKRPGEALTPVEEKLLRDLASQAGLVLRNVRLAIDLRARVEELRASRQRLVAAQDGERRRLERNLHDGAQQNLVALKVKLGLAQLLLGRDTEQAIRALRELKADADEALETLRDLARGIYPPLLADMGLVAALEAQARKASIPIDVVASGAERYARGVEAAVYFCCLEVRSSPDGGTVVTGTVAVATVRAEPGEPPVAAATAVPRA